MEGIKEFLTAVEQAPELWRAIDVRTVAVRIGSNWCNVLTRCYLDHKPPSRVARFRNLPVLDRIGCWQDVLQIRSLGRLVRDLGRGRLKIARTTISVLVDQFVSDRPAAPYRYNNYRFLDRSAVYPRSVWGWSAHGLTAGGDGIFDVLNQVDGGHDALDQMVRASATPFDGIEGLARDVIELHEDLSQRITTFELIAPIRARFERDDCHLQKGSVDIRISVAERQVGEHVQLGFVTRVSGNLPQSGRIPIKKHSWEKDSAGVSLRLKRRFGQDVRELGLMLVVGGYCCDRLVISDPQASVENVRIQAYGVFDEDLSRFHEFLAGGRSKSRQYASELEIGVGRLFTFLGFSTDVLGTRNRLDAAVDLLVYADPHPLLFAVECTTGSLTVGGKLEKLTRRTGHLQESVGQHRVLPVIVTSLDRAGVTEEESQQAGVRSVSVLCREDLEHLLAMAGTNTALSDVTDCILSRVPKVKEPKRPAGPFPMERGRRGG